MFNGDATKKMLLISFDRSGTEICQEQLNQICNIDIVSSMDKLETTKYSHGAVIYSMSGVNDSHLHNISFIRSRFPDKPVYVLTSTVSIPLLLHTTHLHINDVFLLPLSSNDKSSLIKSLNNETSVECFNEIAPDINKHDPIVMLEAPMSSILGVIEESFRRGPTLNGLSDDFHLSPSRLCHMFKDLCGITFSQYVLCRKLEESEHLLNDANDSVTTISYQLGFANPSHFSRCFKEHFNVTPSSYLTGNREFSHSALYSRYQRLRVDLLPATQEVEIEKQTLKVANHEN